MKYQKKEAPAAQRSVSCPGVCPKSLIFLTGHTRTSVRQPRVDGTSAIETTIVLLSL